jgi:PAS domain-containing protein
LRLGRLFALTGVSIVLLIGLSVLVQFVFGIDFGMEQALFRTNEFLGSTPLGRMSPLTAIAFLLEGTASFILLMGRRWRDAPTAVALLAASAIAINTVVLIGYVFGAPLLYGGMTVPVALPTAIAFVLVGIGQLNLAAPSIPALREWSGTSMRGILLRAFLPFLLFFILLDSWAGLAFGPIMNLNPAVWYALKALAAGILVVIITGWIARRTGAEIERAQTALEESEARYRSLFENMPPAMHTAMLFEMAAHRFHLLDVNDAFGSWDRVEGCCWKKDKRDHLGCSGVKPRITRALWTRSFDRSV